MNIVVYVAGQIYGNGAVDEVLPADSDAADIGHTVQQ